MLGTRPGAQVARRFQPPLPWWESSRDFYVVCVIAISAQVAFGHQKITAPIVLATSTGGGGFFEGGGVVKPLGAMTWLSHLSQTSPIVVSDFLHV